MRLVLKTKLLIYQSNANLDVKILFVKVTNLLDTELRETLMRSWYGNEHSTIVTIVTMIPRSILVHDLLSVEL